ncbi:CRISPR-associated endoribonuclease Cas6 [Seinonella peptonophila]|uniref:CRISPR-associated endoribonuclease Cas6 n=1 Tax=Seinonella peptonophila TaxID=112248 RepID=A0A1M5B4Y6_9BACL|nr:CRISPR system precrRNA processing endoribonuclease RAMP protein Cas6 [Seinonella peptonophila]SHF37500.1 CRISPR-associated endoribonuclease Cas6 [Seinonella peptonophila]
MYRLQLHVKANRNCSQRMEPGVLTKRFHAFIFSVIQRIDPQFAADLHSRKQRQLFSFLMEQDQIVIHSPNQQFIQCLQQGLFELEQINLRDWKGKIQEVHFYQITEAEIEATFSTYVTLHFITPTTFCHGDIDYPLPELYRVLTSANKAYELSTNLMVPQEKISSIADRIRIKHVQIETKQVSFHSFRVMGFTGKLELSLKTLTDQEQRLAYNLLVYGALMGIGYKTGWGLGQTRIYPFERKNFSDGL